jgi:outer membrane lipoprotein SlyB
LLPIPARAALAAGFALACGLSACAPANTGSTYQRGQIQQLGQVSGGQVIGMETVQVAGTQSGIGTIGGGVAGGAAGSAIGHGRAGILGGVAGAIGGLLAGSAIEQGLTSGPATRFFIRRDDGQIVSVVQTNEAQIRTGERVLVIDEGGTARITREGGRAPDAPSVQSQRR